MEQAYRFSEAPMLDCTDRHFRVLMRQISCRALLYSEMVVARAIHHILQETRADGSERQRRLERLLGCDPIERPLALQLGGDDPKILAQTAALAAEWGYDEVNLNVGCPSAKVVQGRFGACLMAEPEQVADCVQAMVQASGLPVTVKHRIGIDERDSFAELIQFVDTVASGGASRFSVHARKAWLKGLDPHQNRTVPPLRWDLVLQLKQARPGLLIELNGGLETLEDCLSVLASSPGSKANHGSADMDGLMDGVMVGRAVYGHPLRWKAIDQAVFGQTGKEANAASVVRGLVPHAERWCSGGGRLWPIARHLVHLVQGVSGARQWRNSITQEACRRDAGPEVLLAAAEKLEAQGL
jgi:tRNA-dihydrouridine synthase A